MSVVEHKAPGAFPRVFHYPHSNPAKKLLLCPLQRKGSKGFGWCGDLSQLTLQRYRIKECLCFFIQQFVARDCTGLGNPGMNDVLVRYCCNDATKQTSSKSQWLTTSADFLHSWVGQQLNRDFCCRPWVAGRGASLCVGFRSAVHVPTFSLVR